EKFLRVDLDRLLLRMLATTLWWNRSDRSFDDLEQRLLHAFAGDVASDARVLGLARDLVDFVDVDDAALAFGDVEVTGLQQPDEDVLHVLTDVARFRECRCIRDGERNVKNSSQRPCQKRLADSGRTDQQ